MELRLLRSFVAIAEELHFRRAAARLHMTQPGISQHLRALEEELGARLVRRDRRNVALTSAGEALLREARAIFRRIDDAARVVARTAKGEAGQLVVGATQPALFIVIPELVRAFAARTPDVRVVVNEMTTAEQEAALRSGAIEVGVLHPPLDDDALTCRPLFSLGFDLVLSDRHPLARRKRIALRDLAGEPLIVFPRRIAPRLYDGVITLCHEVGFRPDIALEASPAPAIIAYAAAEFGIGFVASETQRAPRPGVVYRRLTGRAPRLDIALATAGEDLSPAVRTFVDVARALGPTIR